MKRTFALICVFLFAASVSIIPHANASNGLVESGITFDFESEVEVEFDMIFPEE